MKSRNTGRCVYAVIALFLLWIVPISTIFRQELLAGLAFSVIIEALTYSLFSEKALVISLPGESFMSWATYISSSGKW